MQISVLLAEQIVLYIVIPCVMINAFQIDYTPDKVQGMFLALVTSIVLQVLLLIAVWIMGKIFHLDEVEVASIYYSNSGNLIVPIVAYVLGDEWVVYGCVFMAVQLIFMWNRYVDCWYEPSGYIYKSKSIRSYISKIVACSGAGTDYSENQWSGYMASTR